VHCRALRRFAGAAIATDHRSEEETMRPIRRPTIRSRPAEGCGPLRGWVVLATVASAGILAATAAPALASTYTVTDLGSLGFGTTVATGINAGGQITGESYLGTEVQTKCPTPKHKPPCFTHPGHAFLWNKETMTDLGTLGGLDSQGNAISDSGEVVGTSGTATGSSAFTDQSGIMTAINTGDPAAINDMGELAGGGSFPVANTPGDVFEQAFTFQNGTTTVLGLIPGEGGVFSAASGINNSGEVVGSGDNSASDERAWKYQNGAMTDIGTLGGPQASATALNDSGEIVGFAQTSSDADHGFLYTGGKMTDLGLNIFPDAINKLGVIVGQGPGGAVVDAGSGLLNLNNLVPAGSGFTLTNAVGVNNNGQIVANGSNNATGQTNAFLLSPS
jgi:probable HAF family extracellular repeat protein